MVSDLKTFTNKGCEITAQEKLFFGRPFPYWTGFFWYWCFSLRLFAPTSQSQIPKLLRFSKSKHFPQSRVVISIALLQYIICWIWVNEQRTSSLALDIRTGYILTIFESALWCNNLTQLIIMNSIIVENINSFFFF